MTLSDGERETLSGLAAGLAGRSPVAALCAYGSKVAGYARPDSDYDFILALKGYRDGVRYRYIEKPVAASALVVDEQLLLKDAAASYLGEFVVGRLLNVYEPIQGGDLFRRAELDYKKRVIVEGLYELAADYGEFACHFTIPFDFFLFDKLKKRAMLYPPALYSYVKTYTCLNAGENRSFTLEGFRRAAEALAPRGFLSLVDGGVRIDPAKLKGDSFTKVLSMFSLTARGVTQYAVHGYAGRVGLGVFRKEAVSKLRRIRDRPDPPPELEAPRSLLTLGDGVAVVAEASKLPAALARISGFTEFRSKERRLGQAYATTRTITLTDKGRSVSFVVKNFSDVRSLKWVLLGIWAAAARKFSMTPLARLEREFTVSAELSAKGLSVPKVIAVAPDERMMVKEYVEGPNLAKMIEDLFHGRGDGNEALARVSDYGRVMARVHAAGFALGDSRGSNVVVSPRGLFLTDLEQAVRGGDAAWDLAEFVYYTSKLSLKDGSMEKVARAFLSAYAQEGREATVAKAKSLKYLTPFQPFVSPTMTTMLRHLFEEYG